MISQNDLIQLFILRDVFDKEFEKLKPQILADVAKAAKKTQSPPNGRLWVFECVSPSLCVCQFYVDPKVRNEYLRVFAETNDVRSSKLYVEDVQKELLLGGQPFVFNTSQVEIKPESVLDKWEVSLH